MVGFFTAPAIAWGTGALEQLSGLAAERAAVVLDPAIDGKERPQRAVEELERGGAAVTRLVSVRGATEVSAVRALADRLRASEPDWIVVIGGGATIDAVKAARLLLERPELSLDRPPLDAALPDRPRTRLAVSGFVYQIGSSTFITSATSTD